MRTIKVLFVCTGNSARSQMAEGFLRTFGGERFEAHSAGHVAKGINPLTIQVMDEVGIDIRHQRSKETREYMGRATFDYAIIVCRRAEEGCPTTNANARVVQRWLFDDPASVAEEGKRLATFRQVRDQIEARVKLWIAEVTE
jgi:arsenate reductase (thioredoxin)